MSVLKESGLRQLVSRIKTALDGKAEKAELAGKYDKAGGEIHDAGNARLVLSTTVSSIDYAEIYATDHNNSVTRPLVIQRGRGNVGVDVIAPAEKLHVGGAVKASSFLKSDGTAVSYEGHTHTASEVGAATAGHSHNLEDLTSEDGSVGYLFYDSSMGVVEKKSSIPQSSVSGLTTALSQKQDKLTFTSGTTKYLREDGTWQTPAGGSSSVSWNNITNVPTTFAPSPHGHAYSEITGRPTFSLSGSTLTITL